MKLGIVADVHCDAALLAIAAAEMAAAGAEEILLAGDAHYEYRFSNEVTEIIRAYGMRYIAGNHELRLMAPSGERARSAPHVRRGNLDFVAGIPSRIDTVVDGRRLLMVHGCPWPPYDRYLNSADPDFRQCGELGADILIMGHTHVPVCERVGRTLVINPSSLGNSLDATGFGMMSYALLDTASEEVTMVRRPKPETP
ncbi:MAG TPA: metallophosphoesterase family protein [Trebonia sp.]|jgi:putative phosphoesterase|nr:metallophosphoesterase family protein [Trebonia sp.]